MTRAEFVRAYAARSKASPEFAEIGIIDFGLRTMVALPCDCGEDGCEGWAMVSPSSLLDHLFFRAPERLREAYRDAVAEKDTP